MNLFRTAGILLTTSAFLLASCAPQTHTAPSKKTIVVTYSVLGSLVKELVGDDFNVQVAMPNGLDVHEWEPSAKDIEALNKATLLVRNGLYLEGGMEGAISQAANLGVTLFTATDHVALRTVRAGQGLPNGDPDQEEGAQDPHIWLDPLRMKAVVLALAEELKDRYGTDESERAAQLAQKLDELDSRIRAEVATIPEADRRLVTGHESLGYFAEAYGFTLVGAIVPSLTDQAEVSASDMAGLKKAIQNTPVSVLFTEKGTPPKVAEALGNELGLKVVEITTHTLLDDGSYFTFLENLSRSILGALGAQRN